MEGAATWMIEKVPAYPELLQRAVRAELDKHAEMANSVLCRIAELRDQKGADPLGT